MNSHFRTTLAAIALTLFGTAQASDASNFALPSGSTTSRASVQAEARQALAAGKLNYNDASGRIEAPMAASPVSRDSVRQEAAAAKQQRQYGDRSVSSLYYVGGM